MNFKQWLRNTSGPWLRASRASRRGTSRQRSPYRHAPTMELLEQKLALTIFTVTNLSDNSLANLAGNGLSLREAIQAANTDTSVDGSPAGSGADTIQFAAGLTGTITLQAGELLINSDLTLTGPGASLLTINGNNAGLVFKVDDHSNPTMKTVSLRGLTITGGNSLNGGGIWSYENLTVRECTITGNFSYVGAGINERNGALTVRDSTISGNAANFDGGGIFSIGDGALTVRNSTISGNTTNGRGAGIYNNHLFATMTVQNCTITQNHSDNDNNNSGGGGGIYNAQGPVVLYNSIVADNFKGSGTTTRDDIAATVAGASSHNLVGVDTGLSGISNGDANANQIGTSAVPRDPKLGPLQDNGGPTKTHALLTGSPAINAGDSTKVPADTFDRDGDGNTTEFDPFDQRGAGFPRFFSTVDIGAVEQVPQGILVDITADEEDGNHSAGDLSLREALNIANSNPGPDVIAFDGGVFSTPKTITLTLGQLTISDDLTLIGPGAALLTVSGNNAGRIFAIDDGTATVRAVTINGLTIMGASTPGFGGGIFNNEDLTVGDSTLSSNSAGLGGGIWNSGILKVQNSTLSGNTSRAGGGIGNSGTLTVQNTTLSGNSTAYGAGGGVFNTGTLTLTNSSLSSNSALIDGGGIHSTGTLTVRNSTITQNHADSDNSGSGTGGGLHAYASTAVLQNTIIADNFEGSGTATRDDISGDVDGTSAYNLVGVDTGLGGISNGTNGNQVGTAAVPRNPKLGSLAANGGTTLTHALLAGSPAIDAGDPAFNPADPDGNPSTNDAIPFDERGFQRVRDGDGAGGARVDIGAFELQQPYPPGPSLPGDYNQNAVVDAADYVLWRKTLGKTGVSAFSGADGDGDTMIDQDDYGVWRTHFGQSAPGAGAGSGASVAELNGSAVAVREFSIAAALEVDPAPSESYVAATSAVGVAIPASQSSRPDRGSRPPLALMDRYRNATPGADDLILLAIDRIESRSHEDHWVSPWIDNIEHRYDVESQRQIDEPLGIALAEWQ